MAYDLSSLIESIRKRAKDTTFDADLITEYIQAMASQTRLEQLRKIAQICYNIDRYLQELSQRA